MFVVLNLGLIELLRSGAIAAQDGVIRIYHSWNCLYVRRQLKNPLCDEIMSRGAQLPDLFDTLSPAKARREFANELKEMSQLCLALLRSLEC
jgi:hypothetical protein